MSGEHHALQLYRQSCRVDWLIRFPVAMGQMCAKDLHKFLLDKGKRHFFVLRLAAFPLPKEVLNRDNRVINDSISAF